MSSFLLLNVSEGQFHFTKLRLLGEAELNIIPYSLVAALNVQRDLLARTGSSTQEAEAGGT